jgi:hypothetical protein
MGDSELLHALSRLRPSTEADQLSRTVLTALKSVARRHHASVDRGCRTA